MKIYKRKSVRNGYHYNTLYWRNHFKSLPAIEAPLLCERTELRGFRKGEIKSYWFRTATHKSFTELRQLFYKNKLKYINIDYLRTVLTSQVLAYWIMSDGSLKKNNKTLILHTQGFTKQDNLGCCDLLNTKFGLSSRVIPHKHRYWVIEIPSQDASRLANLIDPYLLPSMYYKSPNLYKQSMT